MQTATVISEDRFILHRHLRSLREVSAQLEDVLQQLVDARLALRDAFERDMTAEVQQVIDESVALGVQLEVLYLNNEDRIQYIKKMLAD